MSLEHGINFSSSQTSLETLLGVAPDGSIQISVFEANFSDSGSISNFAINADYDYGFDIGLALDLRESTLGDVQIDYPVNLEFDTPSAVVGAESFTIGTYDFTVSGASLDANSLAFDGLDLNFLFSSERSGLSNISFLNTSLGSAFELDNNLVIEAFNPDPVTLFGFDGGSADISLPLGATFTVGTPEGTNVTEEQEGSGASGSLPDLGLALTETLAEITINPLDFLSTIPGLQVLGAMSAEYDSTFNALGSEIVASFGYSIVEPIISGGYGLVQEITFRPDAVNTTVVIEGQEVSGALGNNFEFQAPALGDASVLDGTLDGTVTYELAGSLVVDYKLAPIGTISLDVLSANGSLSIDGEDAVDQSIGPAFEGSLTATSDLGSVSLFDPVTIDLPVGFFEPISFDLSIPYISNINQGSDEGESWIAGSPENLNPVAYYGNGGDDTITGGYENDYLSGGDGNDNINGFQGEDILIGGAGNDTLYSAAAADSNMFGGDGDDRLDAWHNSNFLSGGAGHDTILGGSGDDMMNGGTGNDQLDGRGQGADTLRGGAGNDSLSVTGGDDLIEAGSGNDSAVFGSSGNIAYLGEGNDSLVSWEETVFQTVDGTNIVYGGGGSDTVLAHGTEDSIINGGGGNDDLTLIGTGEVFGKEGSDTLNGSTVFGGEGNDYVRTGAAEGTDSTVGYGGGGHDSVYGDETNDLLGGGAGNDTVGGGAANDTLFGGTGRDSIFGSTGDDVGYGGDGNDNMFAGDDNDTFGGGANKDTIDGGAGNDTIYGGTGDDEINGGDDDDVIYGGSGNDVLQGGGGDDSIYGGSGFDVIRVERDFQVGTQTVYGFNVSQDQLDLTDYTNYSYILGDNPTQEEYQTAFLESFQQVGSDAVSDLIDLLPGSQVVLVGVDVNSLSEDNFTFVSHTNTLL